jgi:hypothetical protein
VKDIRDPTDMIDVESEQRTSVLVPRWVGRRSISDDEGSRSAGEVGGVARAGMALVTVVRVSRMSFRESTMLSASAEDSLHWLLDDYVVID